MIPLNVEIREPRAAFWYTALAPIAGAVFATILAIFILSDASFACGGESCGLLPVIIVVPLAFATIVVIGYPLLYYLLFSYVVTDKMITVNSGILFREYVTLEYERIQVVDLARGPLLWIFGLTEVRIWTASFDQLTFNLNAGETSATPRPDSTLLLKADEAQALKNLVMQNKSPKQSL